MRTWKWMFTAFLLVTLSAMAQQTTRSIAVARRQSSESGAGEYCRVAARDHVSDNGSAGCLAAFQLGWAIRGCGVSCHGSAHDYGSGGGSHHSARTWADGTC